MLLLDHYWGKEKQNRKLLHIALLGELLFDMLKLLTYLRTTHREERKGKPRRDAVKSRNWIIKKKERMRAQVCDVRAG